MGLITLIDHVFDDTIDEGFWNDIHSALNGEFVGRVAGVATSGQSLGTQAIPWGEAHVTDLFVAGSHISFSGASDSNRIVSGRVKSAGSEMPVFLIPNGSALSFQLQGATTPFVARINDLEVEITSDLTESGLTAAPTPQNTAQVNDADAVDQHATRFWGQGLFPQFKDTITINTIGTEISNRDLTWQAFKINDGATDEYFLAFINGSTLTNVKRGFFFNSSGVAVAPLKFANNDVITLLKLGWVFLDADGSTIEVAYTEPSYSTTAPSSPASGDYWYDFDALTWKRWSGAVWVEVDRMPVGLIANSATACVAARSFYFNQTFNEKSDIVLNTISSAIVAPRFRGGVVNVNGTEFAYDAGLRWNMASNLAASADMYDATEQASRDYFFYVDQNGDQQISDIGPLYDQRLCGYYHPYEMWRCVGSFYNNGSSNLDSAQLTSTEMRVAVTSMAGARESISGLSLAKGTIPWDRLGSLNYKISSSSGAFTTTATGDTNVTNLGFTFVSKGGLILVGLIGDESGSDGGLYDEWVSASPSMLKATMKLKRGGNTLHARVVRQTTNNTNFTNTSSIWAPFDFLYPDVVAAGSQVYQITLNTVTATVTRAGLERARLIAIEL